jgi:hypothetical protein
VAEPGIFLLQSGYTARRLVALKEQPFEIQILLEQPLQDASRYRGMKTEKGTNPPLWNWPKDFDLEASCALRDTNGLWVLSPRKVGTLSLENRLLLTMNGKSQ